MIEKLINKPIAVTMSLIALVILSVMAIQLIPVSIAPDVDIPKITVTINAGNYTARELENVAVKSLRNQLMQINNIDNIHAETKDGISNIYINCFALVKKSHFDKTSCTIDKFSISFNTTIYISFWINCL